MQVFLRHLIQAVIGFKHLLKQRMYFGSKHQQRKKNDRNDHHENERQLSIDHKRQYQCSDQHDRTSRQRTDRHLIRILHIGNIRGKSGDQ